jgi:hypothetical protein
MRDYAHALRGYTLGFGRSELEDQMLAIIDSPEFQRWKLDKQNREVETGPFLDLDDLELS